MIKTTEVGMAENKKPHGPEQRNEGEGNRTAARQYNEAQRRFAQSGKVDEKAHEAERSRRRNAMCWSAPRLSGRATNVPRTRKSRANRDVDCERGDRHAAGVIIPARASTAVAPGRSTHPRHIQ